MALSVSAQTVNIQLFAQGFSGITEVVNAGDSRLFVVEKVGRIKILNPDGTTKPTPFLQLPSNMLGSSNEQGLLGLAFHPNYAINGYFYLNYVNSSGNTVIARYSVNSTNPDLADATSATILLTITQPFANHNGGTLKFGPDGYLYIGMGDGGSGGDPGNRAQNINLLLGKMLRIDVDGGSPYAVPASNPYVGVDGADEIWAVGLRNPWKFSFDSETGDLWIADVGQDAVEEINKEPSTEAGLNYGWKCYEGSVPYSTCSTPGVTYTMPLAEYTHADTGGCSITGGYVYRGSAYPNFVGKYFFADYCVHRIGYVDTSGAITYSATFSGSNFFTTFGVDINNELYVAGGSGRVYKVIDTSLATDTPEMASVALYPNPGRQFVSVQTKGHSLPAEVIVHDLSGKRIWSGTLTEATSTFDLQGISRGFYLVTVADGNGQRSTKQLVLE